MPPVSDRRRHREALQILIGRIVSCQTAPDELRLSEAEVMDEFKVSRGVAREVIRALEERGLVTVKHGAGAWVNPATNWDTGHPDVLAGLLAGPERDGVRSEANTFLLLEFEFAVELAATHANGHKFVSRMREAVGRLEQACAGDTLDEEMYRRASEAFFSAVLSGAENRVFRSLAMRSIELISLVPATLSNAIDAREQLVPHYRKLATGIAAENRERALHLLRELFTLEGRVVADAPPAELSAV
jgi:DNA-binding FadR family transcriptional regulator